MEICPECDWPMQSWDALQKHRYIKHRKLASGRTMPDGTYLWRCNKCEGNPKCDWCYGMDIERITEELNKGARGQRYYALLKAFLSIQGKVIADYARQMKAERGKLRVVDLGHIAFTHSLNFKATVEWLEETHVIRAGAYDRIKRGGLKVKDIYAAAQELSL